jgi:DNA-binding MurR/RpiR family transcriptional regulator
MILSTTVRQEVSYRTVGDELQEELERLHRLGYKVINVTETKVSPLPRMSSQGFIIVYEC